MFKSQNKKILLFNRLILSMLMAFILSILLNILTLVEAQSPLFGKEKIGSGVIETLRTEGEVRVVIALVESQAMKLRRNDLTNLRQEVATTQDDVLSSLDATDFHTEHKYQAVPALSGKLFTEDGLIKLVQNSNVVRIDMDVGGTGGLATSVPLIGANTWHDAGVTGNGVVVAVLDSGLDTDHSDLVAALMHQECFLDNDGSIDGSGLCPNGSDRQSGVGAAEDDAGHGTHVTGIIASRGNQSSVGVAPGTGIVSIKVTTGPSFSGVFYYFSEIVAALDFIINNRPDVQIINMSLVTDAVFTGDCDNSTSWTIAGASAINTLRARGVIAFASSGNTGSGTRMTAPACLSNVISVGATDNADNVASLTSSNTSTDIMAPGVSILSSNLSDGTTTASGTSMASPHAAGCAALLIASGEVATPDQIETRLETSPVQVTDATNGLTFPRIECSLTFDLVVDKVADSTTISPTTTITYTVSLQNIGTQVAAGVVISDTLPLSVTLVTSSTTNGSSYTPTTGVWAVGSVNARTGVTLTLVVTGTNIEGQTIINTAALSDSTPADTNTSNNTDSVTVGTATSSLTVYLPIIIKN